MIDFNEKSYAVLLARMLGRIAADVDKREESLVNTAIAPAAYALEDAYLDLSRVQAGGHIQTAQGADLDLAAQDLGLQRKPASPAVRLGAFDVPPPMGARFSTNEASALNYTVTAMQDNGARLTCEEAGTAGNRYAGDLVAITFVDGLTSARLTDILTPGEDAESDEALRSRCFAHLNANPFAGNVAAYLEFVTAMPGVGGVQIYPTWNGGGTVKLSLAGADGMPASAALREAVQTAVDPVQNSGQGYGVAPIGACVSVSSPETVAVDISAAVQVAQGDTLSRLTEELERAIEGYIASVRSLWAVPVTPGATNYASVLYRARIITAMLLVDGVVNVTELRLGGADADLHLTQTGAVQQLPVKGTVTLRDGN